MTKSKITKRALLASVLSLMLCMAMLVGSTFAWFTDSVTSGKNKIVAGNLDVELSWSTDGETWERVNADTNMFKDALWEPGYTRVVYLKVENVGSLALKYKFGINVAGKVIGKTADDQNIDLSQYIKFGVVDNATPYTVDDAGRTAARNAVKDSAVLVSAGYASTEANLSANTESQPIALVVYMPEEVGNEANHGFEKQTPSIDLGINLVATQWTEESDSFNDQYDKHAYWIETELTPDTVTADQTAVETAMASGGNVKITAENNTITLGKNAAIGAQTGIDLNGTTQKIENSIKAQSGQSLTMINGTLTKEGTFGKVRFDTAEGSEQAGLFDGVTFNNTRAVSHTGSSSNATDDMIQIVPKNGVGKYIFKNCVFNNACVDIDGLSGTKLDESDKIEVVFENCIFNNWGNKNAINIGAYGSGTVTITGCTFNMETTSNVKVVSKSSSKITVTVSDSTINGTKVQAEGEIHVFETQSVKLGGVNTISNVTYQGIATEN